MSSLHARRVIIQRIAALIRPLDVVRAVSENRHDRIDHDDLPHCWVSCRQEESQTASLGGYLDGQATRAQQRQLLVEVAVADSGLVDGDERLDDIAAAIEIALAASPKLGLDTFVKDKFLQAARFDRDSEAASPTTTMTLEWLVTYYTAENDPLVET